MRYNYILLSNENGLQRDLDNSTNFKEFSVEFNKITHDYIHAT